MTESKLFAGRLLAVANYYAIPLLTLAVLGSLGFLLSQPSPYLESNQISAAMNITSLCASFISAPISGLYFAMRCRTFLSAILSTVGLAIMAPLCLWMAFSGLVWMGATSTKPPIELALRLQNTLQTVWWPAVSAMALYHLIVATICGRATVGLLRRRQFVANTT